MRTIRVSIACLLFLVSLSLVGNKLFRSFTAAGQSAALSAPANLTASDNAYATKVAVTWDAVRGATLYRIFRNTTNNSNSATVIGTTPQAIFFDATGAPGQNFFYWVRAENGSGYRSGLAAFLVRRSLRGGTLRQALAPCRLQAAFAASHIRLE